MDKLKNLNLSIIFKKFLICFCICNFLIIGSVNIKPDPYRIYADENINDTNAKSIFINLAFMVMSALGIQTVKSATGLGNAFEGSLGSYFDNWLSTTSLTISALTSMLTAHCHVTKQNNLELGSTLYNTIAGYLNYLYKVPQIFTPADDPFFTYDLPGTYYPITINVPFYYGSNGDNQYRFIYYTGEDVRFVPAILDSTGKLTWLAVSLGSFTYSYDLYTSVNTASNILYNNVRYYYHRSQYGFTLTNQISTSLHVPSNLSGNDILKFLIDYAFGAGAVGGTDGTIGLPDPITRNRDTPIPNVNDGDSVPLAVPDTFAHDWPLDDDTDIPLSVPYAIPWVYDLPIDTPLDVPIDLPFYFSDPGDFPIPPAVIDVPDDWYNVPLIVEPECVSLSGCLVSGVSTVSNHLTNFYNIHPEIATVTALSLGIGFALLVLGVIL